jgi:hypothetical protein
MRQVLAVGVLLVAAACDGPPTRTDRGDGTTVVTSGDLKGLVCTRPDCSGIVDLTISGTDLYSVNLAALTAVGTLVISGNPGLAHLNLPALASARAVTVSANTVLLDLDLPALQQVYAFGVLGKSSGRDLTISGNPALATVELPALRYVTDRLIITDNAAYPQCRAEAILAGLTTPPNSGSTISGNDDAATCPP